MENCVNNFLFWKIFCFFRGENLRESTLSFEENVFISSQTQPSTLPTTSLCSVPLQHTKQINDGSFYCFSQKSPVKGLRSFKINRTDKEGILKDYRIKGYEKNWDKYNIGR